MGRAACGAPDGWDETLAAVFVFGFKKETRHATQKKA
jgi:hypothetical protein